MERYELPDGWEWLKLPDVAEIIMGQSPPGSTYNKDGNGLPFYQGKADFGKPFPTPRVYCTIPKKVAKPGDILMSVRAPVGPTNLVNHECAIGRGLSIIRPKEDVPANYLRAYFTLIEQSIAGLGTGSTFTSISRSDLEDLDIPVSPLSERQRIVAKIESLFEQSRTARTALTRVPALMSQFRRGVLASAFRGELVEPDPNDESAVLLLERVRAKRRQIWEDGLRAKGKDPARYEFKEFEPPDIDELPPIPDRWVWTTLPILGELARGKSKHRPRDEKKLYGGSYPFIQTGDIARSNGLVTSYSQTYSEIDLAQSRLWPKGSLCITIAANIADTALLDFDACFPDSVVGFIANDKAIDVRFIEFFIRTIKDNLEQFAPATAQKNINLNILQNVAVPLPPLTEQKRIVSKIEAMFAQADIIEQAASVSLRRAEQVDQSILARAFRGELGGR